MLPTLRCVVTALNTFLALLLPQLLLLLLLLLTTAVAANAAVSL